LTTACWFMTASTVCVCVRNHRRPIFWQQGPPCFASLCHAKITPALLRRGDRTRPRRDAAEALGAKLEFPIGNFTRADARVRPEVEQATSLARRYARSARYLSPSNRQHPAPPA
jgi:hypothetical protein